MFSKKCMKKKKNSVKKYIVTKKWKIGCSCIKCIKRIFTQKNKITNLCTKKLYKIIWITHNKVLIVVSLSKRHTFVQDWNITVRYILLIILFLN